MILSSRSSCRVVNEGSRALPGEIRYEVQGTPVNALVCANDVFFSLSIKLGMEHLLTAASISRRSKLSEQGSTALEETLFFSKPTRSRKPEEILREQLCPVVERRLADGATQGPGRSQKERSMMSVKFQHHNGPTSADPASRV